tara:strand:+ start:3211 stop:3408 length:198 start_codon:yes stop_codon:yes gene_type:complete
VGHEIFGAKGVGLKKTKAALRGGFSMVFAGFRAVQLGRQRELRSVFSNFFCCLWQREKVGANDGA